MPVLALAGSMSPAGGLFVDWQEVSKLHRRFPAVHLWHGPDGLGRTHLSFCARHLSHDNRLPCGLGAGSSTDEVLMIFRRLAVGVHLTCCGT
jgi:hypothetical protein